jgi:hypothetical protein
MMCQPGPELEGQIDKRQLKAAIYFAISNVPHIDKATLERFLELVNTTGSHGSIGQKQLIQKMALLMKYVPDTCNRSLLTLSDLLDLSWPATTGPVRAESHLNKSMEDFNQLC